MKNVLIISSSPRKGGNTEILCSEFERGVQDAGHNVETVHLNELNMNFCKGCYGCEDTHKCVQQDDMGPVMEKLEACDVVVLATPIYFYEMSGQLKTFLDRTLPVYYADYKFKEVYFLAACADPDKTAMDGALKGLNGWISCFENCTLKGCVFGVNSADKREVAKTYAIEEAYKMGRQV